MQYVVLKKRFHLFSADFEFRSSDLELRLVKTHETKNKHCNTASWIWLIIIRGEHP